MSSVERSAERFVGPLAGRVGRQDIGRVGWRAEAWRCGEDPLVVENLSDDRRALDLGRGHLQGIGGPSGWMPNGVSHQLYVQIAGQGRLALRLSAPALQEVGRIKDGYSMEGAGRVVARVAGDQGIGAGGHGHLQNGRFIWVRQGELQGEGDHRHTLSLNLVEEGSDLLGGEREWYSARVRSSYATRSAAVATRRRIVAGLLCARRRPDIKMLMSRTTVTEPGSAGRP